MLKEPIEPHLQGAIKFLSRHGNQNQQMSHQTPTSSHHGRMVPTPGMAHWLRIHKCLMLMNTMFSLPSLVPPYSSTYCILLVGSMSNNGYQDRSMNVPQNSMATSDSSVMCPVNTQRQVAHMIPVPGFSSHQISPSNPVYPCGAGYLNGESNVIPQVHEQKPMPFSVNQDRYIMQHVGTHGGFGVHSRMLEHSSSYGLSGPQINGDMSFPGSNMQLSYRTVAAKEFMNIPPYGNSPDKSLQQEFICHPPQGPPSRCFIFCTCAISLLCHHV